MKVLIITASQNRGGNTDKLADEFAKGAISAGHEVETISLAGKRFGFCQGCLVCQKTRQCVLTDDANEIVQKMGNAEALVFATPIYYYTISGQLKTLLDRSEPLFGGSYSFQDIYLLSSGDDSDPDTNANAVSDLKGWIDCFSPARLAGTVFMGGMANNRIVPHPALAQARHMGETV